MGLGVKCSKEVATAIRGAIILAKLSIVPVRRGYWGNKIGKPHTVPCKVSIPRWPGPGGCSGGVFWRCELLCPCRSLGAAAPCWWA